MATREEAPHRSDLLVRLGEMIRYARCEEAMISVAELARRSHLSARFLHDVESGKANISVERLALLAREVGVTLSWLFEHCEPTPHKHLVALMGIRGAGKSTIGPLVAKRLACPFYELDKLVEEEAGASLASLFEDRGEAQLQALEARVLEKLIATRSPAVLAAGGSIVERRDNFRTLRDAADTVWLKALPKEHWDRVRKQGDSRPMRGRPDALAELGALWERRRRLYQLADKTVDTSKSSVKETVEILERWLEERKNRRDALT
jgi:XRE family aerobic/anaerobic benzoate catabolism transcriptional regulator